MSIINIVDNALDKQQLKKLVKASKTFNFDLDVLHQWKNIEEFQPIINIASSYFSLEGCLGYEIWEQKNTVPPGWHMDRDDCLFDKKGTTKFPMFTTVFYLTTGLIWGGCLNVRDGDEIIKVKPKRNRLVIFGPQVWHRVDTFNGFGNRHSIMINPWTTQICQEENVTDGR